MRTGVEPRGIVARGAIIKEPHQDAHYDTSREADSALYVGVRFDSVLSPESEPILTVDRLMTGSLGEFIARIQHAPKSGLTVPPAAAAELENAWAAFLESSGQRPIVLADEVITPGRYLEGATQQISVNIYERNPYAREQCIAHHGWHCAVCGFDFEAVFGELGEGFIHVHHLKPLSTIGGEYEVDPVKDLRPICPNCHAMIHRKDPMLGIEDLRARIRKNIATS